MTLPASTPPPSIQVEAFDGPLDLLLDEVRRQNVAIEKIVMAPIVRRFLEYVRAAAVRNLNLDIEWLHMAATLIHWKSRSLLPADTMAVPAADPIRDGLVQQLLAHRKQATEELARRRALEQSRFSRPDGEFGAHADEPEQLPFVSVWDMLQQARDLARWVEQHREGRRHWESLGVDPDEVTVAEMIDYLRAQLDAATGKLDGASLLHQQPTPSRQACLFLGMLEMVRDQHLQIEQIENFGPIWLSWRYRDNATTCE